MNKKIIATCLAACAAGIQAMAQDAPVEKSMFDFGGNIRARYEFKDNWPDKGKSTVNGASEDYLRFRTRIWGDAELCDALSIRLRLANEFRQYRNAPNNHKQEFPDELFVDNLYANWKGDGYSVKAGRQDIKLGSERLVSDGTPGDGSRSTFFDAVFAKFDIGEKSALNLIGTWNHYRNDLSVGDTEGNLYDMTKIKSGNPYSKMDEGGAIAYAEIKEYEDLPFDLYWIFKMEEDFYSKKEKYPGREFHTVGIRLMPKFNDWLSGELEAAWQFGEVDSQDARLTGETDKETGEAIGQDAIKSRDIGAGMLYAGLTGKAKDLPWTPSLTLATLYLTGDKDSYYKTADGTTDGGWNPVFNRTSWFSEIASGMYDQSRWSNLIYPHAQLAVKPAKGHSVSLEVGPMYADEKDNKAEDGYRGLFAKAKYGFPVAEVAGVKLTGAVVGEMLDYGDYYDTDEDAATWARFELVANF
ncbi:MAG: alginate export family protein [Kiritimatiellia bacterium]|jgi:hypothetical protein